MGLRSFGTALDLELKDPVRHLLTGSFHLPLLYFQFYERKALTRTL